MNIGSVKTWAWLHKWSSLVCTAFMLLLCLTGMPLIFNHDINHCLGKEVEAPSLPANTKSASLDEVLAHAKALRT
ncbi:MAG: PepSY domain-containing protein [Bacteroidia bacterium]|nr:PepSY domain-containing protein [Methylotenera sp.]